MTNKKKRRELVLFRIGIGLCLTVVLVGLCALGAYAYDLKKDAALTERLMRTALGAQNACTAAGAAGEAEATGAGGKENPPGGNGGNGTAGASDAAVSMAGVEELAEQNADLAGWLSIPGGTLSTPVMYTPKEPLYYLERNFDGEASRSGTPFIDADCRLEPRSEILIVYGHHMKNGSVFAELLSYREKTFYEAHREILFTFPKRQETYQIFAVCAVDVEQLDSKNCYSYTDFTDEGEFEEYLRMAEELSIYDTGVDASYGDRLLMLSTCSYHVGDGRFIIIAKEKQKEQ